MLAGCAAGGKNTEMATKKEYKPSAMEMCIRDRFTSHVRSSIVSVWLLLL